MHWRRGIWDRVYQVFIKVVVFVQRRQNVLFFRKHAESARGSDQSLDIELISRDKQAHKGLLIVRIRTEICGHNNAMLVSFVFQSGGTHNTGSAEHAQDESN